MDAVVTAGLQASANSLFASGTLSRITVDHWLPLLPNDAEVRACSLFFVIVKGLGGPIQGKVRALSEMARTSPYFSLKNISAIMQDNGCDVGQLTEETFDKLCKHCAMRWTGHGRDVQTSIRRALGSDWDFVSVEESLQDLAALVEEERAARLELEKKTNASFAAEAASRLALENQTKAGFAAEAASRAELARQTEAAFVAAEQRRAADARHSVEIASMCHTLKRRLDEQDQARERAKKQRVTDVDLSDSESDADDVVVVADRAHRSLTEDLDRQSLNVQKRLTKTRGERAKLEGPGPLLREYRTVHARISGICEHYNMDQDVPQEVCPSRGTEIYFIGE